VDDFFTTHKPLKGSRSAFAVKATRGTISTLQHFGTFASTKGVPRRDPDTWPLL
jgi:hypothetical protein